MRLYHFTSVVLAEGIFSSGFDPKPHRISGNSNNTSNVTWFTKSYNPFKTGVCDGSEAMSDAQMKEIENITGKRPKNTSAHNKHQIRISIGHSEIDGRFERLSHWIKRHGGDSNFQKYLGLSACYGEDLLKSLDDDKLSRLVNKGYPDYLVGMRERKVADKLNPQRISWLMARSVRSLAREQILHQTGDAQDQQQ